MLFGLNLSKIRGKKMLNFEERKALLKKALSKYKTEELAKKLDSYPKGGPTIEEFGKQLQKQIGILQKKP